MKSSKKFLKWKCRKTSIALLIFLFTSLQLFSQSCAYSSSLDESSKLCAALGKKDFINNSVADEALNKILSTIGASKRFILRECSSINNACATTYKGVRYIFYNNRFMEEIANSSDDWSNLSILAHEIGHHINGHTLEILLYSSDVVKEVSLSESRKQELEADEFSGFVMARLGATMEQALNVMNIISTDGNDSNSTHPSKSKRLSAITNGFKKGKLKNQTVYKEKVVFKDKVIYQTKTDTIYVTPTKNYEDYFYKGIEQYYNNNINGAIASFLQSLSRNKRFIPTLNNLGLIYNDLKQYDSSIQYFSKAIALDSKRIGVVKNRAIAYYNNNNFNEAIQDCNNALKYSIDDFELYKIRGTSYFNSDQIEKANDDLLKVLSLNENDTNTIYQLGIINGIKGNINSSIDYFTRAINLVPNNTYYFNRAISYIKIGDNFNAIQDLINVIEKDKSNIKALELLADQYQYLAEFEKACELYSRAAKLGSDSANKKIDENCGAFNALNKIKRAY